MGLGLATAQANNVATPIKLPTKTKDQQLQEQAALMEKLQARKKTNHTSNNNNNERRARTPAN
jgi:hypothetical protein